MCLVSRITPPIAVPPNQAPLTPRLMSHTSLYSTRSSSFNFRHIHFLKSSLLYVRTSYLYLPQTMAVSDVFELPVEITENVSVLPRSQSSTLGDLLDAQACTSIYRVYGPVNLPKYTFRLPCCRLGEYALYLRLFPKLLRPYTFTPSPRPKWKPREFSKNFMKLSRKSHLNAACANDFS